MRIVDVERGIDSIVVNPREFPILSEEYGVKVYIGERPSHHPLAHNSVIFCSYKSLGVVDGNGKEVYRMISKPVEGPKEC